MMLYRRFVLVLAATLGLQTGAFAKEEPSDDHWSYTGKTGPSHWAELSKENTLCHDGHHQSPVNITKSVKAQLPSLEFNYHPIPLVIENNGHTIKITANQAGDLKIGEETYHLLQFHTHEPSEEAINGKRSAMVIHLVHQDDNNHLAVVAILFDETESGTTNALLDQLVKFLPKRPSEAQQLQEKIDINQLLPAKKDYYTFEGSLTIPPCSEGVKWIILKQHMPITAIDLIQYQKLYPRNARPLQPLNDREVLSSN
ncbi:MAG: carbonic anhydrase family protein [Thioploca sp.]|nr:carbonic anhydrase family protein [Thioploca sp.]